jgi:hypothetical protein
MAIADDLPLLLHHLAQLTQDSGISLEIIRGRGYGPIHGPESYAQLKARGFNKTQCRLAPRLLIPVLDVEGRPLLYQFRPDKPRLNNTRGSVAYSTISHRVLAYTPEQYITLYRHAKRLIIDCTPAMMSQVTP